MQIEGKVRLITLQLKNSFLLLVSSKLYLGSKASDPLEPLLILQTASSITEFRVTENVKHIYTKAISKGRIGIEFLAPPHHLVINSESEALPEFLELLRILMDRKMMEELEYIPALPRCRRRVTKSKQIQLKNRIINACRNVKNKFSKDIAVNLRNKLSAYMLEIDLPDCNVTDIPLDLGLTRIEYINLKSNKLSDSDLIWLEELPIRKSLKGLNLAENRITRFPTVLVEFQSMISLNFCDNDIEHLPSGIHNMRNLKYLNIAGNNIRFLPGSIELLKLKEFDATYNHLTSNKCIRLHPTAPENTRNCSRLADIAALNVVPVCRQEITYHCYPQILLEILRSITKCNNCDRKTIPSSSAQFFIRLEKVKFALTRKIHPQNSEFSAEALRGLRFKGSGRGNIFLRCYFCTVCEEEYMQWGCNLKAGCHRLLPLEL